MNGARRIAIIWLTWTADTAEVTRGCIAETLDILSRALRPKPMPSKRRRSPNWYRELMEVRGK